MVDLTIIEFSSLVAIGSTLVQELDCLTQSWLIALPKAIFRWADLNVTALQQAELKQAIVY